MKTPITWVTLALVFIVGTNYKYLALLDTEVTWLGFLSIVCICLLILIVCMDAFNTWMGD